MRGLVYESGISNGFAEELIKNGDIEAMMECVDRGIRERSTDTYSLFKLIETIDDPEYTRECFEEGIGNWESNEIIRLFKLMDDPEYTKQCINDRNRYKLHDANAIVNLVINQVKDPEYTKKIIEEASIGAIQCLEVNDIASLVESVGDPEYTKKCIEDMDLMEYMDGIDGTSTKIRDLIIGTRDPEYIKECLKKAEEYKFHEWNIEDLENAIKDLEKSTSEKKETPYYEVAKEVLTNKDWNGLSEEEATEIIKNSSFEEIEGRVGAKGSMDNAIQGIAKAFSLTDSAIQALTDGVYNNADAQIFKIFKPELEKNGTNSNKVIMDTLFTVHDGWVKDKNNQNKFMARDKKHQHMPSELIGWKEAKSDLLFIRPIFEKMGIEVNEQSLETEYNNRVKEFFLNHGIKTSQNLVDAITQGKDFYPALEGYGDVLTTLSDPEFVMQEVIPAIESKGIGKIEDVRQNIVSQVISNPQTKDINRLSESEQSLVEQSLNQEISTLSAQRDELHQKNDVVERIIDLAQRRSNIKQQIVQEEQQKRDNIQSLDD